MTNPQIQSQQLIGRMLRLREWEWENLPTYGTTAGYALFLKLACLPPAGAISLKVMYLSMPCAESTTRLLFRNLERDGLIYLPRDRLDQRFREFQLTSKFQIVLTDWTQFIGNVLSEQ
jgi:hypothetical protein